MAKQLSLKKKGILWGLLIITTLLAIASLATLYFLDSTLNLINRDVPTAVINPVDEFFETDNGEGVEIDPDTVLWPENNNGVKQNKNIINILLIGQDRRAGESRARSDSMMIATLNKEDKTIKITSLLRDMYVQIPGYSDNRINASYIFGGMKLLDEVIEKNFLVKIDGNVEVDFEGFTEGIDIIGGIPITITKKEASYLRDQGFSDSTAGEVNMNGKLALEYARMRKIDSDFGRTERQRKVIAAAFDKVKGSEMSDIMSLANKVLPCITTDMSNDQLLNLAVTTLTFDLGSLEQYGIPVKGSYKDAKIRGMSVLVPDWRVTGKN